MLKHFAKISKPAAVPAPSVNLAGKWKNELNSEMTLTVDAQGNVAGTYRTGVGAPGPVEEFPLVGFASEDLLSFTVNFGDYGSLTSWVGQHTVQGGVETIKAMWLLAKNVKDPDEPAGLWGAVLTGYNNFTR